MKRKLVIITGPPGVGKTTICKSLFQTIEGCAWLDSDWCWMINPYIPKTNEQKRFVEETFTRILSGYLEHDKINTIIFGWVISKPWMYDLILKPLEKFSIEVFKISLVCSDEDVYRERLKNDHRRTELILQPYQMKPFQNLDANLIDVSYKTISEIKQEILEIIR